MLAVEGVDVAQYQNIHCGSDGTPQALKHWLIVEHHLKANEKYLLRNTQDYVGFSDS
jgi:hypothetical protein